MKKFFVIIVFLAWWLAVMAEPFCRIRTFDEDDGLSQHLVKGVAQDRDGVIWIATWNGLNRFDGSEFATIRPTADDEASRYSDRIGELKLGPDGKLLLRVDERLLGFDVRTHRFSDLHRDVEQAIGRSFRLRNIILGVKGEVVLECDDGAGYIIMSDGTPVGDVTFSKSRPVMQYATPSNRTLGDVGPYSHDNLALSRIDDSGRVWLITRDGEVVTAPALTGPFTVIDRIQGNHGIIYYSTTDRQNNIWLRSASGLHRVTLGELPYRRLSSESPSAVRFTFRDSKGRFWVSESDTKSVAVYSEDFRDKKYLAPDGSLSSSAISFGYPVYTFYETSDGTLWIGTKPDGLFRLSSSGIMSHFTHDPANPASLPGNNIYDMVTDSRGRLWIATMSRGIGVVENPLAPDPVFRSLYDVEGYPTEAKLVRRLTISGDTMLLAATTAGLLAVDISGEADGKLRCGLMQSEPGVSTSIGNIAVMDVAVLPDGRILAATESDGVNIAVPGAIDRPSDWKFTRNRSDMDVALSIGRQPFDGSSLIVNNNRIFSLNDSTGEARVYGPWFWGRRMRFSDGRPTPAGRSTWLVGDDQGAVIFNTDSAVGSNYVSPVMFTGVSVENRPDSLLSMATDTILLGPKERNLTLRFSALDYSSADHHYAYRINDENWIDIGGNRALTFLDLEPGTIDIEVRASSASGEWIDNAVKITVIVTPTFWETTTAKVLYVLVSLLIIGIVVWIVVYIRRIKRKQRETLTAYLNLLQKPNAEVESESVPVSHEPAQTEVESLRISDEDREFMDNVMAFVNDNMSDSDISVDDMVTRLSMSRSSLNRKIKSLTGLTPAEFLRESRLSHAAMLLLTTELPVKEIAFECGFSDLNYFGKCFKASRSVTPSAYRKSGG